MDKVSKGKFLNRALSISYWTLGQYDMLKALHVLLPGRPIQLNTN